RLTQLTYPDNATERYAWDQGDGHDQSLMVSSTDTMGNTETYEYDPTLLGGKPNGNLVRTVDRGGNVTAITYGPFGQVASITKPDGRVTTFTIDPANSNVTAIEDALHNRTTMTYNPRGLVTSRTAPKGNLTPTPDPNYTTSYTYDASGAGLVTTVS